MGEVEQTAGLSDKSIKLQILWARSSMGALKECLYGSGSTENKKWGVKTWHGERGIPAVSNMKINTSRAVQITVWTGEKYFMSNTCPKWISLPSDLYDRALATPCVLSNHQGFTFHPWPPFPLPPPSWMWLSTLSFPVVSALSYFPTPCKWHWPAHVNSHSAEEMSQSFGVPNADRSSITRAANTRYAPITGRHSHNCNSIQSCKKAQSTTPNQHQLRPILEAEDLEKLMLLNMCGNFCIYT